MEGLELGDCGWHGWLHALEDIVKSFDIDDAIFAFSDSW